jgi:hypothetical protein
MIVLGPDLAEPDAVLAAVKTATRRLRRWPSASLDRGCARRSSRRQSPPRRRPGRDRETLPGRTKKRL